ncbi:ribonuclease E/G [Alkalibacillus aidingensis]|uniref:ribonuclease E/G n=1 Tax=Alkalibacillus aidingensis TaxID=2747607 RepID=UPI00166154A1|nr:ribonuclease E/G [Alkalibacillus aidingensis]
MRKIYLQTKTNHQLLWDLLDGQITHVQYQQKSAYQIGDMVMGVVQQIDERIQACFVDIGLSDLAYLPLSSIDRESRIFRGQALLLQVKRLSGKGKSMTLSPQVELKNPYMIYLPGESVIKYSNKLNEDDYLRVKHHLEEVVAPDEGVIVRTRAKNATKEQLHQAFFNLKTTWERIERFRAKGYKGFVDRTQDRMYQYLSRLKPEEVDEVVCDDLTTTQHLKESNPQLNEVIHYDRRFAIHKPFSFERTGEMLTSRKVKLASGASITIDRAEALTAIDIDTGSYRGNKSKEEAVKEINLEAAKECARQLRIRELSGAIIIDFLNVKSKHHQHDIIKVFKQEATVDDVPVHIAGFTNLGMLEVTRKRMYQDAYQFFGMQDRCMQWANNHYQAKLEEDLLTYEASIVEYLQVKVRSDDYHSYKKYIKELNEQHQFHFDCYLTQDSSLQAPYQLFKIGEVAWLLNRMKEEGNHVDKLF